MDSSQTDNPGPISPRALALQPYQAGEQPRTAQFIKLNTNENPYPPSPRAVQAIALAAQSGLQLYPDPQSRALCEVLAAHHGLSANQVFVGNGSDEILALAFYACFQHGAPLLFPDVTYSFYRVYCRLLNIEPHLAPLNDDWRLDVEGWLRLLREGGPWAGAVLANPNAPTGIALSVGEVERLALACAPRVLLVDEAYVDFGAHSAVELVRDHANVLVVQTLSKSRSLAGLRVGAAFGSAVLIDALTRVKDSFNSYPLDRLAQAGAAAAYEDKVHFEKTRHAIMQTRAHLSAELPVLGFDVTDSAANFVFVRHKNLHATDVARALRERSILVRHFSQPERIANWLRITVGTDEECAALLAALRDITSPG